MIRAYRDTIAELETALAEDFEQHPDAKIILSMPGLGTVLGARVLGEFGDDPNRYADSKSRKNYAGTSPMTKASGKSRVVLARYARNRRLVDAARQWAFCSLRRRPGLAPTTTNYEAEERPTNKHFVNWRIDGSASCTPVSNSDVNYDEGLAWKHRADIAA